MGPQTKLGAKRLGRLFSGHECAGSLGYAAVPVVRKLDDSLFQVFFSDRDENNRSFARTFIFDMLPEPKVVHVEPSPVLLPSSPGLFDDNGVMPTAYLEAGGEHYIFYIGWNRAVNVPFRNSIGLAKVADGRGTLERVFEGAILDRNVIDSYFVASCDVHPFEGAYRIWYLSCTGWEQSGQSMRHKYHIRYADSEDLVAWDRRGQVAVDFKYSNEYAISTPRVYFDGGYHMLYSYRGGPRSENYRIGYATSSDGNVWRREDEALDFDASDCGWDSEMICYPYVFDFQGKRYFLYNGNDYGRTGIGLAEMF